MAERVVVDASDSQVAAMKPMAAASSPATSTPRIEPSQIGSPSSRTNHTAVNAPNIPVAACAKFTTRTSRDIRVRHTPSTA